MSKSCLLDVNALIALADAEHVHYQSVMDWFDRDGHRSWGICPLTEAGFVRVTINPVMKARARTLAQAVSILQLLKGHPGCRSWNVDGSWVDLTAPFATRIVGHHQVMDALLLGLAVREGGVLVTFDRGLKYVAGDKFSQNLLVLEQG